MPNFVVTQLERLEKKIESLFSITRLNTACIISIQEMLNEKGFITKEEFRNLVKHYSRLDHYPDSVFSMFVEQDKQAEA